LRHAARWSLRNKEAYPALATSFGEDGEGGEENVWGYSI
jgi:hypothetical protein